MKADCIAIAIAIFGLAGMATIAAPRIQPIGVGVLVLQGAILGAVFAAAARDGKASS